jgi:hypothetical protein
MMAKRLSLILFLMAAWAAKAQIGMQLTAANERYLRYEPIELKLLIQNYSGNTLVFGGEDGNQDQGSLTFRIDTPSGRIIRPLDPRANLVRDLIFKPGERREVSIIINSLYDMQRSESYTVTAHLEHRRLPKIHISNSVTFEVNEGSLIMERSIGLPAMNPDEKIKSIDVRLLLFNSGTGMIYCLMLEDDENVYGTFRIGPYISGSAPQMDVDSGSTIHVLLQVRPRLYSYTIYSMVNMEAKLRQTRYYVPENGVPTLSRDTGYLKVLNARRAQEGVDFQRGEENWKRK